MEYNAKPNLRQVNEMLSKKSSYNAPESISTSQTLIGTNRGQACDSAILARGHASSVNIKQDRKIAGLTPSLFSKTSVVSHVIVRTS